MDDLGNAYHPVVLGADTTDLQAGTLTRITEALTKGAPAAAISGAMSIYNTFLDYAGQDQVNIESAVRRFSSDEVGDFYAENKEATDIVGFVAGAILPSSLGIKGVQMLRSGTALGNYGKALGYAEARSNYWLQQALKETAESGGTVKNLLQSSARRKQLGWEMADQALLSTAAELAVVATMNDSPIFDGDSAGDFGWNVALGTALGGGIGGALGSLAAKGILKTAGSQIQSELRLVDTIFNPERMGLNKGTEIASYLDNMLTLPDGMEKLGFKYQYNGRWQHVPGGLDISASVRNARDNATKLAQQQIAIKFNELAAGDAVIGQAYSQFVLNGIDAARSAGKSPDEIVELLHGYLENVSSIGGVDLQRMALDARKFYVNLQPTGTTPLEQLASSFSRKRTATTTKQAYILADDVMPQDLVTIRAADLGTDKLKDIWKLAPDADAVQLPDGSFRFNPRSSRVLRYKENPHQIRMFLDVNTGTVSPETVPVFADITVKGKLVSTIDYISAGGTNNFRMAPTVASRIDLNPIEATARFAWASSRSMDEIIRITGGKIQSDDIPVLQRLVELEPEAAADTLRKLKFIDDGRELAYDDLVSLKAFVDNKRIDILQKQLDEIGNKQGAKVPEARVVAANLGVTREWAEEAMSNGFKVPKEEGGVLETLDALRPQNIAVTWDFGMLPKMLPEDAYRMNMGPSHLASQELSRVYQIAIRKQIADNAILTSMGEDADLIVDIERFMPEPNRSAAQSATAEGAGASMLGASNANYGDRARLAVQESGKNTSLLVQRRRDAVVESLAPYINSLRNSQQASAELGILTTALRGSEYSYVFDPQNAKRLISRDALDLSRRAKITVDEALDMLQDSKTPHSFSIARDEVADFLMAHSRINATRNDKMLPLWNAVGLTRKAAGEMTVYVPPINTVRYPYHAFVRTKTQVGVASDVTMITAKSEQQLRDLAAKVGNDYDVIYKSDVANYYKARGEYDYGMTLNESAVNSDMARRGVLADFFPETRLENIMEDYLQWHARQEEKHVRMAVQVKNQQFFNEMRFLSEQYRKVSESVTRGIGSRFKSKVADPFGDYTKTALDISKQQEFPLLDSLNDFVDNVGRAAGEALEKGFRDAKAGIISYQEANKIADRYGLGMPYKDIDSYISANERYPRNLIREGFQKANLWLATTTLRLDMANSLVNIISTPIMLGTELSSIKQLIKNDSALSGKLNALMSLPVPGRNGARMPSTTHLIAQGINNYFGQDKALRMARYREIGAIKEVSQLYHEVLDDLSFRSTIAPKQWIEGVSAAVEKGAKITGNTFAEDFTRFISADVMRQLTDPIVAAKRMTIKEQNAYISTFVNRVQGNYVTSQRPVLFQGTTGAAVSLFQTYAFNVLQQLHRHMQAGDKKTLAIFAGLQASVFGMNGLPFFDAVNTHLIGGLVANNPEHKDAYSVLPAFNKELGDWMLYGTASALPLFSGSSPALFTRGDINPRHITILPTNPLEVPAVQASLKLFDAVYDTGKKIVQGADVTDALLQGLEHQGWNRPLAGFAQLLAGQSTTSKGALISAANDMETTNRLAALAERTVSIEGVSRLLGARPMDEAVALNTLYRQKTYQAMDRARLERLGQVVKTKLYGNEVPTDEELEDFMLRYARTGGRMENFSQAMQRWSRDANVSVVNQLADKLRSPYGQTLQSIMGGERLSDYRSQLEAAEE
jgi:hypothetical protein